MSAREREVKRLEPLGSAKIAEYSGNTWNLIGVRRVLWEREVSRGNKWKRVELVETCGRWAKRAGSRLGAREALGARETSELLRKRAEKPRRPE